MTQVVQSVLAIAVGYFLGSIPSAYIAGRVRKGVDIREVGSGNVGVVNVFREIGAVEGVVVWLVDMAKGAGAVLLAQLLVVAQPVVLVAGAAAVVGHVWPVFLGFRGGKGLAVTMGIFFALFPWEMLMALGIAAIPVLITRNITFGMAIGLASLPLFIWLRYEDCIILVIYAILLCLFLIWRHLPTAREALATRGIRGTIFDHWKRPKQGR